MTVEVIGTPQQEAIWSFLREDSSHGVVEAVAGSGKTFTIVEGVKRLDDHEGIAIVAFNRHIAIEMKDRLNAAGVQDAQALTYNSFGFRACLSALPGVELDDDKLGSITDGWMGEKKIHGPTIYGSIAKLVRLCKCYLVDFKAGDFEARLSELADRHDVEINGHWPQILDGVPEILRRCLDQQDIIDFDDQIWFPIVLDLPITQYEMLLVDESQDTNHLQQELAIRALSDKGRLIVVGDSHQAIYGFRGADVDAIPSMRRRLEATALGCQTFPLTRTRRCPSSHVALAQTLVPEIEAWDGASAGEIREVASEGVAARMKPGDLALCRVNRELVAVAYDLLRRGVKAVIRGRDIGAGLVALVEKLRSNTVPGLLTKLNEYEAREIARINTSGGKRMLSKMAALTDRCATLRELCEGQYSVVGLRSHIQHLFAEFDDDGKPKNAVILGTVHRTKGLEANNVFVLAPHLIPHPMARQEWEIEQERNLAYVAATRAKYDASHPGVLTFAGAVPYIYSGEV